MEKGIFPASFSGRDHWGAMFQPLRGWLISDVLAGQKTGR
jgi:hypothetical protein